MELSNSKWLLRGCMWFSVSDLVTSLWLRYGRFVVFACFSYVYVQPDCKWWPATNGTPQYHHVETVRDCWRLLPSRFSSDLPYALCGSQFYPLEKIELTGLRNNTWNMELNGPLAWNFGTPKSAGDACGTKSWTWGTAKDVPTTSRSNRD